MERGVWGNAGGTSSLLFKGLSNGHNPSLGSLAIV